MVDPFNAIPLNPLMRGFIIYLVDHINQLPDDELKMTPTGGFKIDYDHPQLFLVGSYWRTLQGAERAIANIAFACRLRTKNPVWKDGSLDFNPVGKSPIASFTCTAILQV